MMFIAINIAYLISALDSFVADIFPDVIQKVNES